MAMPQPIPKWDDEHTVAVPMTYVRMDGTSANGVEVGPRHTIRVCETCRKSRELCTCAWRNP